MDVNLLHQLENAQKRNTANLPTRFRPLIQDFKTPGRGMIVTGPRGVGKTTLLLHLAKNASVLYLSADHPSISEISLYELGAFAFQEGYEGLAVDEVHFAKDWSRQAKALYDDYPEKIIWLSDSSSIILQAGTADLSRRFVPRRIPFLSFREYAFLKTGRLFPALDPFAEKTDGHFQDVLKQIPVLRLFRDYKKEGTRPIFLEGEYRERLLAVLDKTFYSDIPFFLSRVTADNLRIFPAIVGHLAHSAVPRLSVRSLCADWGIGPEKLYQLLFVMESVGLLRIIRMENDHKARSVGAKMFFADPTLYAALDGDTGNLREAFAAMFLAESGRTVSAARDETKADFTDGLVSYEIGGSGKHHKSADFAIRDDMEYRVKNGIPLWMLGFLY